MEKSNKSIFAKEDLEHEKNFQINDYTLTTPFEVLVNSLEKTLE
jgi:hypothetical protein